MQRQKTEARLGSSSSFPESPTSFEDDTMEDIDGRMKNDFDRSNMMPDRSTDDAITDITLIDIGQGVKQETKHENDLGDEKLKEEMDKMEMMVGLRDRNDSVASLDGSTSPGSVRSIQNQITGPQHSPIVASSKILTPSTTSPMSPLANSEGKSNTNYDAEHLQTTQLGPDTGQRSTGCSPASSSTTQLQLMQQSLVAKFQSSVSSEMTQSGSNQGTSMVKPRMSPRENIPHTTDSFYQTPGCETNFPGGGNQYSARGMVNGGYNLMDNYSQSFPSGSPVSRSSKDNLQETFGHQQISGHKSNPLSPLEKLSALQHQQKRYSYTPESSSHNDNGYKNRNINSQYNYASNFDMNSNTYHPARGYPAYTNRIHGDTVDLQGSVSMEEFGGNNPQLKQGPFTSDQLNAYQSGVYYDGNYRVGYNAGVNRTMPSTVLSQQNYLTPTQPQHGSNMADNNGIFEQFNGQEGQYNSPNSEFSSIFAEYYNYSQQGFST